MSDRGLVFTNVSKRFGDKIALSGVEAQCAPGRVTGLIGANGAGKSTFIHLAAGVLVPTSGTVRRPEGGVGWCAQRQMIDWFVDCRTNVWLGARLAGKKGRSAWDAADRALAQVSLTGSQLAQTPEVLSGGQQQRLMIARTLAMEPELLLLDEPTVGLDAANVVRLTEAVAQTRDRGATVIVSSHEFESVEPVLDEVLFLAHGSVAFCGSVEAFVERYVTEEIVTLEFADVIFDDDLALLHGEVVAADETARSVTIRVARGMSVAAVTQALRDDVELLQASRRPASLRDAVVSATGAGGEGNVEP